MTMQDNRKIHDCRPSGSTVVCGFEVGVLRSDARCMRGKVRFIVISMVYCRKDEKGNEEDDASI